MARFIWYKCPDCSGTFKHLHHPSDAPPPDRCPMCGAWVSEDEPPEEIFVPQAPGIRKSAYAQAVDQSYRAMEEASAQRAEDAVEQLEAAYRAEDRASPHEGNVAVLDDLKKSQIDELRSGLKITNMKDPSQMREGETAAIMPRASEAAQRLTIGPSRPGFQMLEGGRPENYQPGIGPSNAGDTVRQAISGSHAARAGAMFKAGQIASYTPKQ